MRGLGIFCYPPKSEEDLIVSCEADFSAIKNDRTTKEDTESGAWFLNYLMVRTR
jgi:hypothetical protein